MHEPARLLYQGFLVLVTSGSGSMYDMVRHSSSCQQHPDARRCHLPPMQSAYFDSQSGVLHSHADVPARALLLLL
jgi:hypothetical protein